MAYKFQRGDAILSGSIKAEDGLVATDVDATTADFVVAALTAGDIPFSKLAIANTKILIGDGDGHAQEFSLSGDVTMNAGGVVTIANNAVEGTMLDTNVADASTLELSSDSLSVLKVPNALTAGDGIAAAGTFDGANARSFAIERSGSAHGLSLNADGLAIQLSGAASGLAIDAGGLTIDADPNSFLVDGNGLQLDTGVAGSALSLTDGQLSVANLANAQIAANAAIAHTKLAGITAGSILMGNASAAATATAISGDISLANNGGVTLAAAQTNITSVRNASLVIGSATGNDHIDFSVGGTVAIETNNVARISVVDATTTVSNDLIIAGNLTVQGASVEVQQGFVVTSSVQFEGSTPDGNEISLTSADPSADRTITLPDLTGHVPLLAGAISSAVVTSAEFLLLDGDTSAASTITVADADRIIINDDGTMKQIAMSDVKSYVAGASTLQVASKADGNALEEDKVNYFADLSSNATVTLPASAAGLIGKSIYIKAKDLTSGATIIINTQAADQKIDGENSIVLESPYASVRLIYVATDDWRVF